MHGMRYGRKPAAWWDCSRLLVVIPKVWISLGSKKRLLILAPRFCLLGGSHGFVCLPSLVWFGPVTDHHHVAVRADTTSAQLRPGCAVCHQRLSAAFAGCEQQCDCCSCDLVERFCRAPYPHHQGAKGSPFRTPRLS